MAGGAVGSGPGAEHPTDRCGFHLVPRVFLGGERREGRQLLLQGLRVYFIPLAPII